MGKHVWMKFPVYYDNDEDNGGPRPSFMFYKGIIIEAKNYFLDGDTTKSLEWEHYVRFGDSDDGYYNLSDQEATGYLKWSQE